MTRSLVAAALGLAAAAIAVPAQAFVVRVVDADGSPVSGFRYLVEKDNTNQPRPGVPSTRTISLDTHKSHAPVLRTGHAAGSEASVRLPRRGRYFVSVLPDGAGYTMSGAPRRSGQGVVTVTVHRQSLPTAQITVLAFIDQNPTNDGPDPSEQGLGGATVVLSEAGGPMLTDVFGNPLDTIYLSTCLPDGTSPGSGTSPCLDAEGAPVVDVPGDGVVTTLTQEEFDGGPATNPHGLRVGEAVVKNIAMGKYGVVVIPPFVDDAGIEATWVQTTTIEGTKTIDAWVTANEPNLFVEGFGTGFKHVVFGYVKTSPGTQSFGGTAVAALPANPGAPGGTTIEGTLRWNHFARPPNNQGFFPGEPVPECWVGLTNPAAAGTPADPRGIAAQACDADSHFTFTGVPDGTYTLVWWDRPLDGLFGFTTVTVAGGAPVDLGDLLAFRWFGTVKGRVFHDLDEDGFRDETETGVFQEQNVILRFRDGTEYQAQPTDGAGEYELGEVFPFFKWLVVEVDFARFKATGMTAAVDYGGAIPPLAPGQYEWEMPSFGSLNPQPQRSVNPNTGNNLSRTESGPVLTQAMHLFLNQTNVIEWGKTLYGPGENGGVSGIVFYDTTRAEDDPAFNGGEPWQPGVPDVQVALYEDNVDNATGLLEPDGVIDDVSGNGRVQRADVDNPPFGWADGGRKGPEDVDRNRNGVWDPGDAVGVAYTDSWDRNEPRGCVQNLPLVHGVLAGRCADAYSTWNQVRPGVFDGGYAFNEVFPGGIVRGRRPVPVPMGTYIVEVAPPPGYEVVKEEDKNVDFGDAYVPGELLLPPPCVGDPHLVPAELTLFPGVAPFHAGATRPLCDLKQVEVTVGLNAAAEFFIFTHVPKAARAFGFTNNDLSAEFNMGSPNFGEKLSPSWIPVSFRDWTGREVNRVYSDEYGHYNALLPSTFTMNVPAPSGVAPNMLTVVLNDPYRPDGTLDPFYNPTYSVTPWTLHYYPGTTTYLDTPLVPLAAFAAHGGGIDTFAQTNSPVFESVTGPEPGGGPYLCDTRVGAERRVTLTSLIGEDIINPDWDPNDPTSRYLIHRRLGFGRSPGRVTLDGTELTVLSWHPGRIEALVPDAVTGTGVLHATRSNGVATEVGVRFSILDCAAETVIHVPADFPTIQEAIDAASPGDHVFVSPGHYRENVILNKPVVLQGSGQAGTRVNGDPQPAERLQAWHARLQALGADLFLGPSGRQPFMENEAPALLVVGETPVGGDTFNPGFPFDAADVARVDNFTFFGSKAGGGVFLAVGAHRTELANNVVVNNQGNYGGGIVVGAQDDGLGWTNQLVAIRGNKIHRNGGVQGAGGIALYGNSEGYAVEDNLILGNFSRGNGGGIGQTGFCNGANLIAGNEIRFNEVSFGAVNANAGDGGGIFLGSVLLGGTGTGSVTIERNLIQGNLSGAGRGGGIRVYGASGADVTGAPGVPAAWDQVTILNNLIVNNVAGHAGGGISLQDAAKVLVAGNTVANNDATATSALAQVPGQPTSTAQPAGIVSYAHSATLATALLGAPAPYTGQTFSAPVLDGNIVWNNRSFRNNAALNAGAGGLEPNPDPGMDVWDLQVVGTAGQLSPQDCVLTKLADASGDYSTPPTGANLAADPSFVAGYENQLASATVIDEGGNATTVRFTPLLPHRGDYHLNPNSPAIDAGGLAALGEDYDGDARPAGAGEDVGADEYVAPVVTGVRVLTPNGGERIPSGSTYTVTWAAPAGADHYTVSVSYNRGRSWTRLASGVTDTWLAWTVPTPRANNGSCLVRVVAFDAGGARIGRDTSDGRFAIEVVRLLRPNGSEVLIGGSVHPVSWTTNVTAGLVVRTVVQRSFDGGRTWSTVASLAGNPGAYDWAVPNPRGVQRRALLRVRLFDGTRLVGTDRSDRVFLVRPALAP